MVVPSVGQVVTVPFPFSDLSQSKIRPALCVADSGRGDWILCQITSSSYADLKSVRLNTADFLLGGLRATSYARPGKLFTANTSIMLKSVATLKESFMANLLDVIVQVIRPTGGP
jgi:mRNA interferase MazF